MTTEIHSQSGLLPGIVPAPPRWAIWAAHAAPLCALPSGLWRVAMAVGIPVGFSAEVMRSDYDAPGWGSLYMVALSVLIEALTFLTVGLVRPWGEIAPNWIPVIGGKQMRPLAVVRIAGSAALLISLITFMQLFLWFMIDDGNLAGTDRKVMGLAYLPLVAWGPLLGAATISYRRRHRAVPTR